MSKSKKLSRQACEEKVIDIRRKLDETGTGRIIDSEVAIFADPDREHGWGARLRRPYKRRVEILLEELEKLPKESFVYMTDWVVAGGKLSESDEARFVRSAMKNPCGTAACIAGKAGLMPRFRKLGFRWNFEEQYDFEDAVYDFFGLMTHRIVFANTLAIQIVDTVEQAVVLVRHFLNNLDDVVSWQLTNTAYAVLSDYVPPAAVQEQIRALAPEDNKRFPVSEEYKLI